MNDRLIIAASVIARMAMALLSFILLARAVGPAVYGFIGAVFAYATLVSLFTDFGLAAKSFRDIAANPDCGGKELSATIALKIALIAVIFIAALPAIVIAPLTGAQKFSAIAFAMSVLVASVGDLALVAHRAASKHGREMWETLSFSTLHLCLIGLVVLMGGGLVWFGVTYLASRIVYTIYMLRSAFQLFPGNLFSEMRFPALVTKVKRSATWGADSALNYLNGQVDAILGGIFLSSAGLGAYLTGARAVQSILGLSTVFANIHLPRLATLRPEPNEQRAVRGRRAITEYAVAGCIAGLIILWGGPFLVRFGLGERYETVNSLWSGFAVFAFMRFTAGGFGVVLTASGSSRARVAGQAFAFAAILMLSPLIAAGGVTALPWVMSVGAFVNALAYALACRPYLRKA